MKLKGHDLYLQKYTCNELTKKVKTMYCAV